MNDAQAQRLYRKYWDENKSLEDLARECSYSASGIYYQLVKKRGLQLRTKGPHGHNRAMTAAEVRQARRMVAEGETVADVARFLDHPYSTVHGAVKGYWYQDVEADTVAVGERKCKRCGLLTDDGDLCYYCQRGE